MVSVLVNKSSSKHTPSLGDIEDVIQ